MKFLSFWTTSIYTSKNQVRVEVGESHFQEIGGRKWSCTCKIQVEVDIGDDHVFLSVLWRHRVAPVKYKSNSKLEGATLKKSLCFKCFSLRHRVAPVNYKSKSKLEGPMFKNSMFSLLFLFGKSAVEESKCIDLLNQINGFLKDIDLYL